MNVPGHAAFRLARAYTRAVGLWDENRSPEPDRFGLKSPEPVIESDRARGRARPGHRSAAVFGTFQQTISPNSSFSGRERIRPSFASAPRVFRTVFAASPVSCATRASQGRRHVLRGNDLPVNELGIGGVTGSRIERE